ncbi:MAG: bifunctional riboflavin kinase/FAD synthetase [Alphaproteobacteria bacterium]|nr:bifunctional riboflavin kinase/FAD synthetase [Alphaproteobacteria bacterium]MBU1512546.1 bifunctional riboflavin kinase/FAD synthetase [Alphaproteobacteria bacterium]MBU2092885.1 bifunctional riboflavin kinase/FAD synthetase [Alphaproteobacteria bacterium]MBU2150876.1 bifunctional riboflavin kinase/FAD synthetase [Alphaproteobacteria bacterium]MBU2307913.1 bifunctional riboflavin kinase/FAD synthetase [Alphaproteobacteria bacterium]
MKRIRVIRGWKDLSDHDRGAAVAMGSFDGVHLGHQQVIELAARAADDLGAPLGVITFDPHPRVYFRPDEPAFRLMKTDQQARALEKLNVDILYVLPLDAELAEMTDREFATKVLHDGLGARHVAVGFDNSFGKDRTGTPDTMRAYGKDLGFGVSVAEPVGDLDGDKFSSTAVREALRDGQPEAAAEILGRPFAIEGSVQRGRQLGRKLGFPTANVDLGDYVSPKFGVYATRTRLSDGREFAGVANIGVNPTVHGVTQPLLEVWLFDFDEDIYDRVIETDLIAFLRPEEKFSSLEVMTEQVMKDAARARQVLGSDPA